MLFARVPLTILAGLALVNGREETEDTGADGIPVHPLIDTGVVKDSAFVTALPDSFPHVGRDVPSLLSVLPTGTAELSSIYASYLSEASGLPATLLSEISSLLGGVTGTGGVFGTGAQGTATSTSTSTSKSTSNAAIGVAPMGAMSSALLAGLTTVSAGVLAGAWFVL
ncbi:hypothetical protein BDZ89DRAFT_1070290 [Hymenopellis radicata]|nr:hypothetical protein BDZ89DRAFT_1070290 [Hymenopellis radicata]